MVTENVHWLRKMISVIIAQFLSLFGLTLQLHGLIMLWRLYESQRNDTVLDLVLGKRNPFLYKLRKACLQRLRRKPTRCWYKPGWSDKWWDNMLGGRSPEESWKTNLRMTKSEFHELADQLANVISPTANSPNYRALSTEKKLAVTLYFLKDTGSLSMTANTFGIHISTVSVVLHEVCKAIAESLGPKVLSLPSNVEQMRQKVSEFQAKCGMVQVFGCIDSTHIPIKRPFKNSQSFVYYKMFHSLKSQAVCDYRGMFIDVECRWPGSTHDAKVFAKSSINQKLKNGELPKTLQTILPGCDKIPNYLIGDPAYPLTPFCMREFDSCTADEQVVFDGLLQTARNPIESAFGRLKTRWAIIVKPLLMPCPLEISTIKTILCK